LCNTARHIGATLNGRRDPGYELRILHDEQSKLLHEQRRQQLRSEIELIKRETELIMNETDQIKSDTEQIERETEQL